MCVRGREARWGNTTTSSSIIDIFLKPQSIMQFIFSCAKRTSISHTWQGDALDGMVEPSNTDTFGPLKYVLIRGCLHFWEIHSLYEVVTWASVLVIDVLSSEVSFKRVPM